MNFLDGITHNYSFFFVQAVIVAGQILIIFKGGEAFGTVELTGAQWGWSMLFGLLTFPVGFLVRLVPDRMAVAVSAGIVSIGRMLSGPAVLRWKRVMHGCFPVMFRSRKKRGDSSSSFDKVPTAMLSMPKGDQYISLKSGLGSDKSGSERFERDGSFDLVRAIEGARPGSVHGVPGLEVHPDTCTNDILLGRREEV